MLTIIRILNYRIDIQLINISAMRMNPRKVIDVQKLRENSNQYQKFQKLISIAFVGRKAIHEIYHRVIDSFQRNYIILDNNYV